MLWVTGHQFWASYLNMSESFFFFNLFCEVSLMIPANTTNNAGQPRKSFLVINEVVTGIPELGVPLLQQILPQKN